MSIKSLSFHNSVIQQQLNPTILIISSLMINLLSLAMPLMLLQIYDRILPNQGLETLAMLVLGVGTALLLETCLRIGRSYLTGWAGAKFEHVTGCQAMQHLSDARLDEFEHHGSGAHLQRLNALATMREFYSGQALTNLIDLPFVIIFLVLIAWLGGVIVWVPITLLCIFAFLSFGLGRKLKAILAKRIDVDDRRYNFIIEVLRGIHSVKSHAMEPHFMRRYERLQHRSTSANYDVALASNRAFSMSLIFSQITMAAVVAFGSLIVLAGDLTVGGLAACTLLSGRTMQPLQRALGVWTRFQNMNIAKDRLDELFAMEVPKYIPEDEMPEPHGMLILSHVSLTYPDANKTVLDDVNLIIRPGEAINIRGENGCGKSSLLHLMMGVSPPSLGDVIVDGMPPELAIPDALRAHIGYLPQKGVVFEASIMENLTLFRPEREDKARLLAEKLLLDQVINKLPLGYNTMLQDGPADPVSIGVKQKIAIIRALVDDPAIILYDNADSLLNREDYLCIYELIASYKKKATLVLASNHQRMSELADRCYALQDGTLNEISQGR